MDLFDRSSIETEYEDYGHHHDGDDDGHDGHHDVLPMPGEGPVSTMDGGGDFVRDTDIPLSFDTDAVVELDVPFIGEFEFAGDADLIRMNLEAGVTYSISVNGVATDALDAAPSSIIGIFQPGVGYVVVDQGGGEGANSKIYQFTPEVSGEFYLYVGDNTGASTGGYEVVLEVAPEPTEFTVDQIADFLVDGSWAPVSYAEDVITFNVDAVDDLPARDLIVQAFQVWADVADIEFQLVTGVDETTGEANGMIVFDDEDSGAYAQWFSDGNGNITNSFINVSRDWVAAYGDTINSYTYQTFIHEIGHALGLGHGGQYNGSADYGVDNHYTNDTWGTTVMSYFSQGEAGFGTTRLVLGAQVADIVAMAQLYGAETETRTDDTTYGFNTTEAAGSMFDFQFWTDNGIQPPSFAIYDNGGTDTFDLSGYNVDQTISLVEETWSSVGDNTSTYRPGDAVQNVIAIGRGTVIENAIGGSGDDLIIGNAADNRLEGGEGSDTIDGGEGEDTLVLSAAAFSDLVFTVNFDGTFTVTNSVTGDTDTFANMETVEIDGGLSASVADLMDGAVEGVRIEGTDNSERLRGTEAGDLILGFGGDDRLIGLAGNDVIAGYDGDDTLVGGEGDDALYGGEGNDRLVGGEGQDLLSGNEGADRLVGGAGDDEIYGGDGNDRLVGQDGDDHMFGGDGDDVLVGGDGDDYMEGDDGDNWLVGGAGDDLMVTNNGDDYLNGGTGDDLMAGRGGDDHMVGGEGDDTMYAGSGNDRAVGGQGDDVIYGGDGDDTLVGGEGGDDLYGESGNDRLVGGEGGDFLSGGDGDDVLLGGDGLDIMGGGEGNDRLVGGEGNDSVFGGAGDDVLVGSEGDDALYGEDGDDRLVGGEGDELMYGGMGADRLLGGLGDDEMYGGDGEDFLDGGDGDDVMYGDAGDDVLRGSAGDDVLFGGDGDDRLVGGSGDDVLVSTGGNDVLIGGSGSDIFAILPDSFVFVETEGGTEAGVDGGRTITITDFTDGEDLLDLTFLDLSGDSLADAGITVTQRGNSLVLDLDGQGTVVLRNVDIDDFDIEDVILADDVVEVAA